MTLDILVQRNMFLMTIIVDINAKSKNNQDSFEVKIF